jgi:F-type H+-transporting ATPase subunit c
MRKLCTFFLAVMAVMLMAPAVFAQEGGGAPAVAAGTNWVAITAGFGMALAAAGCGIAQSKVASAACEGMARNPGAADPIRAAMFLGLVFVETLALFTLATVFTLIFRG